MAVKFEKVKVGDTLYDRARQTMGNTAVRSLSEWRVQVLEKQGDNAFVVSWNGNRPQVYGRRNIEGLFTWSMYDVTEADLVRGICHSVIKAVRLPKKEREARKKARAEGRI